MQWNRGEIVAGGRTFRPITRLGTSVVGQGTLLVRKMRLVALSYLVFPFYQRRDWIRYPRTLAIGVRQRIIRKVPNFRIKTVLRVRGALVHFQAVNPGPFGGQPDFHCQNGWISGLYQ